MIVLKKYNVGGGPNTATPIILSAIVDINYKYMTVENHVVSKFWTNPSEMKKNGVILGRKLFALLENHGDHLKRLVNPRKLLRHFYPKSRNDGLLFFFFGMLEDGQTTKLWRYCLIYLNCINLFLFFLLNL